MAHFEDRRIGVRFLPLVPGNQAAPAASERSGQSTIDHPGLLQKELKPGNAAV
jgi:hypothetical protein